MNLIMFAGPNGSGKSTLIDDFLSNPRHQGLLYICPDAFFSLLYPNPPTDPEKYKQCYIESMELSGMMRKTLVNSGKSFVFETVFSVTEKVDFLKRAKGSGYMLSANFVTTRDPDINIARVAQRKKAGGHDVPVEKIVQRYYRSMEQLAYLFDLADELNIYDNSSTRYKLVYQHNTSRFYFNQRFSTALWVRKYIIPYIPSHFKK